MIAGLVFSVVTREEGYSSNSRGSFFIGSLLCCWLLERKVSPVIAGALREVFL